MPSSPSLKHPWRVAQSIKFKLRDARKAGKQLYDKRRQEARSPEEKAMRNSWSRTHMRKKANIPTELPVMKPWDFSKGKVTAGGDL